MALAADQNSPLLLAPPDTPFGKRGPWLTAHQRGPAQSGTGQRPLRAVAVRPQVALPQAGHWSPPPVWPMHTWPTVAWQPVVPAMTGTRAPRLTSASASRC